MTTIQTGMEVGASWATITGWCLVLISTQLSTARDDDLQLLAGSLCNTGIILFLSALVLFGARLFVTS